MSIINELKYKMLHSGSKLYLFIGINVLIFLVLNLIAVPEYLFTKSTAVSSWLQVQLSMPAHLPALMYKPWTILTYMFTHKGLFHILFNMLWLYWMGRIFEEFLNNRQFVFTYFAGGISGAILFIVFYNIFPAFSDNLYSALLIGASASVMAVVVATATLLPEYTIQLLFFWCRTPKVPGYSLCNPGYHCNGRSECRRQYCPPGRSCDGIYFHQKTAGWQRLE